MVKAFLLVTIAVFLMSGCSEVTGSNGRYQGVEAGENGVFVVDTKTAQVRYCRFVAPSDSSLSIRCITKNEEI